MKEFPQLFKRTKTGKIQSWNIKVESSSDNPEGYSNIIVSHGQLGGKIQENLEQILEGKQNRSIYEQAVSEAQSKFNSKKDEGYKAIDELGIDFGGWNKDKLSIDLLINLLDKSLPKTNTDASGNLKPMLAKSEVWTEGDKRIKFPCYIQPKLDGVRCLCFLKDNRIIFLSREGTEYTSLGHIADELKDIFKEYPNIVLDGEIYIHGTTLQDINSYVRRFQLLSSTLEYHIYDLAINEPQNKRFEILDKMFLYGYSKIRYVNTMIAKNEDDIKTFHKTYKDNKYEGAMLRNIDASYGFGTRSSDLVKVKSFIDSEFKIIGGKSGKGKFNGCCIFMCLADNGKEFEVLSPGTIKQKQDFYDNLSSYIGKEITVKYSGLTPEGKPFHPIGKAIKE